MIVIGGKPIISSSGHCYSFHSTSNSNSNILDTFEQILSSHFAFFATEWVRNKCFINNVKELFVLSYFLNNHFFSVSF